MTGVGISAVRGLQSEMLCFGVLRGWLGMYPKLSQLSGAQAGGGDHLVQGEKYLCLGQPTACSTASCRAEFDGLSCLVEQKLFIECIEAANR